MSISREMEDGMREILKSIIGKAVTSWRAIPAAVMVVAVIATMVSAAGCARTESSKPAQSGGEPKQTEEPQKPALKGQVLIDGSSTVFPITEAVAEEFQKEFPDVSVNVGISGTGGGFKKFVVGETDINNASREIKPEEQEAAQKNGIDYVAFKIGYDGITVVTNKSNTWCKDISLEELKKIWEPTSKVKTWADVRKGWPAQPIKLFGPDADSGTFDYFTEAVVGEAKKSRADYTASADDNTLVMGVAGEKNSLGYFGFAYYEENTDKLNAVSVNGVAPSLETIRSGAYPLSRPLFIYVSKKSLEKPEVYEFVSFYLKNAETLVKQVGYVPLSADEYRSSLSTLEGLK